MCAFAIANGVFDAEWDGADVNGLGCCPDTLDGGAAEGPIAACALGKFPFQKMATTTNTQVRNWTLEPKKK